MVRISKSSFIDLCGKTNIKQLAAISEVSDLFFGVDSAPMHIAAAIGTPVVALFGPSGAFHWGPWDNESSKLRVKSLEFKTPYPEKAGYRHLGFIQLFSKTGSAFRAEKMDVTAAKSAGALRR